MAGERGRADIECQFADLSECAGITIGAFCTVSAFRTLGAEVGICAYCHFRRIRAVEHGLLDASDARHSAPVGGATCLTGYLTDAVPAEPAIALWRLRGVP